MPCRPLERRLGLLGLGLLGLGLPGGGRHEVLFCRGSQKKVKRRSKEGDFWVNPHLFVLIFSCFPVFPVFLFLYTKMAVFVDGICEMMYFCRQMLFLMRYEKIFCFDGFGVVAGSFCFV